MMVRSVDDHHVDIGAAQCVGREQPAEAGADNRDAMPLLFRVVASREIRTRFALGASSAASLASGGVTRTSPK